MKFSRLSVTLLLLSALPLSGLTIRNQYIEFGINDFNHRLELLRTTGGNPDLPSDDNKNVIHRKDPSMSSLYVFVDGKSQKVGVTGRSVRAPYLTNNNTAIASVWNLGKITVKQIAALVEGTTSGRPDSVRFTYEIRNNDSASREIGVKLVMDTFLGPNVLFSRII